ncbi:hypothetical protein LTR53_019356, partial [Teratosphaeriaceae sp. CCFEE 6253]
RVPSHSKKAHERLHSQRSIQRVMSPPPTTALESRNSVEIFSPTTAWFVEAQTENPFGRELAQLDEVAEEFGQVVHDVETADDIAVMQTRGFACYSASDYMSEIQDTIYGTFTEPTQDVAGWI